LRILFLKPPEHATLFKAHYIQEENGIVNVFRELIHKKIFLFITGLLFFALAVQSSPLIAAQTETSASGSGKKAPAKDKYTGIFPEVVARVNNEPIYGRDLERAIRSELIPIGSPNWTDLREDYRGQLVYSALTTLINSNLLYMKAVSAGVEASDDEVQDEYLKMTQKFKDEKELKSYFDTIHVDETTVIKELHRNLVISKLIDQVVRAGIKITPEEMAEYYKTHPNEFKHPDIVRTSQILIESDGSPETDAKAKRQAEEILKRIEQGEDFADLARKYSKSPSASQGGDLGYSSKEALTPDYAEAAFSMPVGKTRLIKTDQGYRILKVTDRKKEGVSTLEEAEESLREFLANEKTQTGIMKLINNVRDESDIEYLIPAGPTLTP